MLLPLMAENIRQLLLQTSVHVNRLLRLILLTLMLLLIIVRPLTTLLTHVQCHVEVGLSPGTRNTNGSVEVGRLVLTIRHVFIVLLLVVIASNDLLLRDPVEQQVWSSVRVSHVLRRSHAHVVLQVDDLTLRAFLTFLRIDVERALRTLDTLRV